MSHNDASTAPNMDAAKAHMKEIRGLAQQVGLKFVDGAAADHLVLGYFRGLGVSTTWPIATNAEMVLLDSAEPSLPVSNELGLGSYIKKDFSLALTGTLSYVFCRLMTRSYCGPDTVYKMIIFPAEKEIFFLKSATVRVYCPKTRAQVDQKLCFRVLGLRSPSWSRSKTPRRGSSIGTATS